MWTNGWRDKIWSDLEDTKWDVIVIGGGITGAGILREAVQSGFKTLLVEAQDFSSGTSSRSSKLVHGGMRYLKYGQFKLVFESVSGRQSLLKQGPGLINHLDMVFATLQNDSMPGWMMGMGLVIYGAMAGKWQYKHYDIQHMQKVFPAIDTAAFIGGYPYYDAQTDDARLTLRVIREAVRAGGTAINYARASKLLRDAKGEVVGVVVEDTAPGQAGRTAEVTAPVVINATGVWGDELRRQMGYTDKLRPLRGSHLIFPRERLPLTAAISINHIQDGRPVFAFPWEGVTIVGTTDVDVAGESYEQPSISQQEAEYLLDFVRFSFPAQNLSLEDVTATLSGIRPVINTGKANPSEESREHAIHIENRLVTVSGGKLTTFHIMARDVLRAVSPMLPARYKPQRHRPVLDVTDAANLTQLTEDHPLTALRLTGRYGWDSELLLDNSLPDGLETIGETPYIWNELRWAAQAEGVVHLDDLLLRRARLGLLLPQGGQEYLPKIREIAQPLLGWDDSRWEQEQQTYLNLWKNCYYI